MTKKKGAMRQPKNGGTAIATDCGSVGTGSGNGGACGGGGKNGKSSNVGFKLPGNIGASTSIRSGRIIGGGGGVGSSFHLFTLKNLFNSYFSYSTVREAKTYNTKITIIYRATQLAILFYIFGWDLGYKKSYQLVDKGTSTVSTKVKGIGYVDKHSLVKSNNLSNVDQNFNDIKIFDTSMFVIPPNEYNSIFVMTNYIETTQSEGRCDEDETKRQAICQTDSECVNKTYQQLYLWNGVPTGKCVNSKNNPKKKVCEIFAWCPVERDDNKDLNNHILNVLDHTIFIRNDIHFMAFDERRSNLPYKVTSYFIQTCSSNQTRSPYCPVFTIEQILTKAEPDAREREIMMEKGGIIVIKIKWDCDFDLFAKECLPEYTFKRFDFRSSYSSAVSGFNFRYSTHFYKNHTEYRKLVKAFGIRFIIQVDCRAGKFNFIPLLVSLGSGIGLLAIPMVIADCILLNLTERREFYKDLKMYDLTPNIVMYEENGGPIGIVDAHDDGFMSGFNNMDTITRV